MKSLFLPGLLRQRWMPLPSVGKPRACGAPAGSTVRPDEAAVQTFDGEVLAWLHLDRRVVGIARQQPDPGLADLEQLDRDFLVDPRHHDLARTRVNGAVHTDQVAVENALDAHRERKNTRLNSSHQCATR